MGAMKSGKSRAHPTKLYPVIGCCGIDCGLCPRYYTIGASKCPGCCGLDFFDKHPSCSFITCCVKKNNLEVCAQCDDFPCPRFDGWDAGDSFVTHLKSVSNLNYIKEHGKIAVLQHRYSKKTKRGVTRYSSHPEFYWNWNIIIPRCTAHSPKKREQVKNQEKR